MTTQGHHTHTNTCGPCLFVCVISDAMFWLFSESASAHLFPEELLGRKGSSSWPIFGGQSRVWSFKNPFL